MSLVEYAKRPVRAICSIADCDRPVHARGWCAKHYDRVRRTGTTELKTKERKPILKRYCSVDGCDRVHNSKGYCIMHYQRLSRTGDLGPVGFIRDEKSHGENLDGYRRIIVNGKRVLEHRAIMEQILGRELNKDENVHHKNGDRMDNRPENLELWSSSQPPGQRIQDKVDWAIELLSKYAPYKLKEKNEFNKI